MDANCSKLSSDYILRKIKKLVWVVKHANRGPELIVRPLPLTIIELVKTWSKLI